VRGLGGRLPRGRPRGDTARERHVPRGGGAPRVLHRDDGRLPTAHPPPPADEPAARARHAHPGLLHLSPLEHPERPHPPRRPPPLFLGSPAGVPCAWTLRLCFPWLVTVGPALAVYVLWDTRAYAREARAARREDRLAVRPLRVAGKENLVLLCGVVVAAAFLHAPWREAAMVALAIVSLVDTPRDLREANQFSFQPILEVAAVFAGIFLTMLPALDLLRARGGELGVREPWQFFWASGALSSFLDNAPTYLTFLALAQGQGLPSEVVGVPESILTAISLGSVFMGANTYIGNGPNFMVRSIAEARGVRMPSFGGYMLYSGAVLLPVFLLVTFLFFRP